jgi:hypothetical protein
MSPRQSREIAGRPARVSAAMAVTAIGECVAADRGQGRPGRGEAPFRS